MSSKPATDSPAEGGCGVVVELLEGGNGQPATAKVITGDIGRDRGAVAQEAIGRRPSVSPFSGHRQALAPARVGDARSDRATDHPVEDHEREDRYSDVQNEDEQDADRGHTRTLAAAPFDRSPGGEGVGDAGQA
jgi:hypothetical protein